MSNKSEEQNSWYYDEFQGYTVRIPEKNDLGLEVVQTIASITSLLGRLVELGRLTEENAQMILNEIGKNNNDSET